QTSGAQHLLLTIPDHLGSTSMVIDYQSGELVERTTYLPYGSVDSDYRPSPKWDSFRETYRAWGKENDVEVGLYYFGARYFSAALNRFISPDPLTIHGLGADLNPYAYVGGRPLFMVDPLGLAGSECDGNSASCRNEVSVSGDDNGFLGGMSNISP